MKKEKKLARRTVPETPFKFLKLPPEVRKQIYELVFYRHSPPYVPRHHEPSSRTGKERPNATVFMSPEVAENMGKRCLKILLTCREIFMEAYPIFYRINVFYFKNMEVMTKFLQNIGAARRQELVEVHFAWLNLDVSTIRGLRLLKTCRNLKAVGIDRLFPSPEMVALKEVRGLQNVYLYDGSSFSGVSDKRIGAEVKADLLQAMMRPRLKKFATMPPEGFKFLKERRGQVRKTSAERLIEENQKYQYLVKDRYSWK